MSEVYEDCNFWKIRACRGMTTNNCWNTQCPDYKRVPDHSWISTKELTDALAKREGVQELNVPDPDHGYTIHIYGKTSDVVVLETGAARILVVID